MKTLTLTALIVLLGFSHVAHAKHSHRGDTAKAAIGGLITGVVLSELLDDDIHVHATSYRRYDRGRPCPDTYRGRGHHRYDYYDRHRGYDRYRGYERHHKPSGRWEYRTTRIWVPGYYVTRYEPCGRKIRIWRPGRYEFRKQKVWVPYSRYHRY